MTDQRRTRPRVALIGMGGLGCPAALALTDADVDLVLLDDDEVELTNLHRQVLYEERDVGRPKLEAARDALVRRGVAPDRLTLLNTRFLPENSASVLRDVDLVLEGSDNFATKFLAADACFIAGVPVVHGAAIRWRATAWLVSPRGKPCYRCLFEDLPRGAQQNCDSAGVMGPVVGLAGALMAELGLRWLAGEADVAGSLWTYDGLTDRLREVPVASRPECALCGSAATIHDTAEARYLDPLAGSCQTSGAQVVGVS
ncbi:MAG: HesA/MoeB/ThiF family protein [Myxococcales bacterium]|nr:HesA/MoeB/ThiF family protein [Myxococcales bacterium]